MNKKYCPRCGVELDLAATFCPKCGERMEASATGSTPIQQYNANLAPRAPKAAKIDVKKTLLSNIVPVCCLIAGIALIVMGIGENVPTSYISSYSMHEYVGGDAYNFIVEAGLRGGRIAGAMATKAIYIAVGLLISCISAMKIRVVKPSKDND